MARRRRRGRGRRRLNPEQLGMFAGAQGGENYPSPGRRAPKPARSTRGAEADLARERSRLLGSMAGSASRRATAQIGANLAAARVMGGPKVEAVPMFDMVTQQPYWIDPHTHQLVSDWSRYKKPKVTKSSKEVGLTVAKKAKRAAKKGANAKVVAAVAKAEAKKKPKSKTAKKAAAAAADVAKKGGSGAAAAKAAEAAAKTGKTVKATRGKPRKGKAKAKARRPPGGGAKKAARRKAGSKRKAAPRAKGGPSNAAIGKFLRTIPSKATLTMYPGTKRAAKAAPRVLQNPRGEASMATYANPRRRRRRRRNPGMVGGAISTLKGAVIPGALGGAAAGLIDARITGSMSTLIRIGAKVVAAGVGGALLRNHPVRASAFVGAMVGTAAYEGGLRLGGGMLSTSKKAAFAELASMAAEDESNLGMLTNELQGMGLLQDDMSGSGEPDLGDLEPSLGDLEPSLGDADDEMAGEDFAD